MANLQITIDYKGLEIDIGYQYQPMERDSRDTPGCAEKIEGIDSIEHKGVCLFELLEDEMEKIEEAIYEEMIENVK